MFNQVQYQPMLSIFCPDCNKTHLVGTRHIVRFENTPNGPIADVKCVNGHIVTTDFGRCSKEPSVDLTQADGPTPKPTEVSEAA